MLFFTKVRGIETGAAGILLSAMGIGGFLGAILNSKLSDIYGRKIVMIIGSLIGIIGTLVVVLVPSLSFGSVFFVLLVTATACWGNAPIFLQIIPSDCVSREHLAKTLGVIVSIGEFVGIAIAPPLLGLCGDMYGLAATMLVGATSIVLTTLLSLALRESAPKFCQVQANPRLAE
jgi:MFS family permease